MPKTLAKGGETGGLVGIIPSHSIKAKQRSSILRVLSSQSACTPVASPANGSGVWSKMLGPLHRSGQARAAAIKEPGLCLPCEREVPVSQPIPRPHRHNKQVGIMHVMPTSA
jgi:hypothetical protein